MTPVLGCMYSMCQSQEDILTQCQTITTVCINHTHIFIYFSLAQTWILWWLHWLISQHEQTLGSESTLILATNTKQEHKSNLKGNNQLISPHESRVVHFSLLDMPASGKWRKQDNSLDTALLGAVNNDIKSKLICLTRLVLTEEDIVKNHEDNNLCRMCTYKTVLNMWVARPSLVGYTALHIV